MENEEFKNTFKNEMRNNGFKRRASHWYKNINNILYVVNLQKSHFGDEFYINISCVPDGMAVTGLPFPKEYKCPIRLRLGSKMPEQTDTYIKTTLDMSSTISNSERELQIKDIIRNYIIPIADKISDIDKIKSVIINDSIKGIVITKAGLEFLGILSIDTNIK
ncbi:DUF4304 domain-containing protein [Segnochrobactraceae bacterium EtOH-i3]